MNNIYKKEDIENYFNNHYFCELKPSNIHGVGVFALRPILKDTNIFVYLDGYINKTFNIDELNIHPNIIKWFRRKSWVDENFVKISFGVCQNHYLKYYLNHSDNPTLKHHKENNSHKWIFTTMIDIEEGEELTFDYNSTKKPLPFGDIPCLDCI